jgi:hypothetical protein
VKDQHFLRIQFRTLEISEYVPGFIDCVEEITEIYMQEFVIGKISDIKDPM